MLPCRNMLFSASKGPVSRLLAALTVVAMLILQAAPIAASASGNGMWIEICSEAGIVLKQVDMQDPGGTDDTSCPACAQCPFCAVANPDAVFSGDAVTRTAFFVTIKAVGEPQTFIANPAQFWPDNRGPPRAEKNMRSQGHDPAKAFSVLSRGASWS